jgi:hypothetical protein
VEDYLVAITSSSQPMVDSVTLENGQVVIRWTGTSVLQYAPSVLGPWDDVPNASSPFPINPGLKPVEFYRLRSN